MQGVEQPHNGEHDQRNGQHVYGLVVRVLVTAFIVRQQLVNASLGCVRRIDLAHGVLKPGCQWSEFQA